MACLKLDASAMRLLAAFCPAERMHIAHSKWEY
jgi:hypothetical protein